MKWTDLIPAWFMGGPLTLLLMGASAQLAPVFTQANLAIVCTASVAAGMALGLFVMSYARRPTR
jgi:uncharacterized protein YbjT (DUF2867 family)